MRFRSVVTCGVLFVCSMLASLCQAGGAGGFGGFGGGGGGSGFSFGIGGGGASFGMGSGRHGGGLGFGGGHGHGDHGHGGGFNFGFNPGGGIRHQGHAQQPHLHVQVPVLPVAPRPVAVRPAPKPVPVAPVAPVVAVKPNVQPPEKIVALRSNARFKLGELMPQPCYGLLAEVARVRAQQVVIEMEPWFAALANPNVANLWTIVKVRVQQGQPVLKEDLQRLQTSLDALAELPAGISKEEMQARLARVGMFSRMLVVLATPYPAGGWTPGIPSGAVNIVYCPCLPKDQHFWLPNGDLACGTGGTGEIALTSGEAAKALNLPLGVGPAMPESDADVAKRVTSGVLLMNPEENAATIQYVLANKNYSLTPSFKQSLPEGQAWVVSFDRGAKHGTARYTLNKGTYLFSGSQRGWDLYNQKFQVTIDNAANPDAFHYAIDNKEAEVPAGARATYSSDYPLLVRFDRGDGMKAAQKKIDKPNMALVVAMNGADGLWDLYPATNFPGQKLTRTATEPAAAPSCCE